MLKSILSGLAAPFTALAKGWDQRRTIKAQTEAELRTNKVRLDRAKTDAEIKRLHREAENDYSYDMQVLKNRSKTWSDELLILVWIGLLVAPFVPYLQPYVAGGWKAMGYNQAPWWYEFGMVGILISTLGLMQLFKIWFGLFKGKSRVNAISQAETRKILDSISLALNHHHNTVTTDRVDAQPDEQSWRVDFSKELAALERLERSLLPDSHAKR